MCNKSLFLLPEKGKNFLHNGLRKDSDKIKGGKIMKPYYQMGSEEVRRHINGSAQPLSAEQIKANQEKYGPNELAEGKKKSIPVIFL